MALVQVLKSAGSSTFGELASKYFKAITTSLASCKEVHIVFDQYWDASIKAGERACRGSLNASLEVKIHGPSTPVPKQWGKYIPTPQNKINLYDFLSESFCILGRQQLPPEKNLLIGGGEWQTGSDSQKRSLQRRGRSRIRPRKKQTQGEINTSSGPFYKIESETSISIQLKT